MRIKRSKDRTNNFQIPPDMCSHCKILDNKVCCTFIAPYKEFVGYCCNKECAEYDSIVGE